MKDTDETIHLLTVDNIIEIGIDGQERLYVKPEKQAFDYIYRAAAEVNWDSKEKMLFSPKPREWSYLDWYKHILATAKDEYGCTLLLRKETKWTDVPADLKQQILLSS